MKKKVSLKIALDIDDVLAGFYPAMCLRHNKNPKIPVDIWDSEDTAKWVVEGHKEIENDENFWMSLDAISKPEDINFIVDCYITSSPKKMLPIRRKWLRKHGFPIAPVYQRDDKIDLMKKRGVNIFIDDKLSTVKSVNENNILGLQFKPEYMIKKYEDENKIITNLNEIGKFLKWKRQVVDSMKESLNGAWLIGEH